MPGDVVFEDRRGFWIEMISNPSELHDTAVVFEDRLGSRFEDGD